MTQKIKILLGFAIFILFIAGASFAYNSLRKEVVLVEPQENETQEEKKAPDFTVEDSEGNAVKLSDMVGKPVVVNFWASWCPPCKAEMPDFERVYTELGSDIIFMMVNMTDGQQETKEKGAKYISDEGFSFPVYYDIEQDAAYKYGIRSIPTTIFIDSDGFLITGAEGQIDEEILRYGISLIQTVENEVSYTDMEYNKISAKEAKEMMNTEADYILLDVRTDSEYQQMHIPGAILIPDTEINQRAETELPGKDVLILVYCRSGRRSANAANELASMGYSNIYDFGGIIDWPYELE